MKKINLKKDQLQIYKRENSKAWQIKLKLPRQKAIRKSSGSKILEEAKKTALGIYDEILNNKKYAFDINKSYNYKKIHLVESKKLNKKEIECFLDESEKYIHFNKKTKKKSTLLEGRSIFNLFFEDSTRTRTSFEVAAKRLGADLINVA